jgi:gas vesicle protein GvpL/GvpF
MADGTYLYCVIAAKPAPRMARSRRGLPGTGPVRLLDVDRDLFLVVADAPLSRYGEAAIARGLNDLNWVSRAAVAHESVVESFMTARAVVPFKLFTIFANDSRAIAHVRGQLAQLRAIVRRVANQDEWSVRLVHDGDAARGRGARRPVTVRSGAAYLAHKKARRDEAAERAERARETAHGVFERIAARAKLARRRGAGELPVQGGSLLLDAAFLVPRARTAGFRAMAAREARTLAQRGYGLTLTGPWPPYTFVQD